jgi:hypothetical protein
LAATNNLHYVKWMMVDGRSESYSGMRKTLSDDFEVKECNLDSIYSLRCVLGCEIYIHIAFMHALK